MRDLANRQIETLQGRVLDELVQYDIQDEDDRNAQECPSPQLATEDAHAYGHDYLAALYVPVIIKRAVGKYGLRAPATHQDLG